MSLTANDKGGAEFALTPEGTYVARCYKVIDLGTQTSTGMFGTKDQHKVMVSWELLDDEVKMDDGRPYSVTQWYTVSLHEKSKLRADLEAWRGRKFSKEELEGFDLQNVLGSYCMLQVVHDDSGKYANVNSIMAFKGVKPKPVNGNVIFDIDEPDMDVYNSFSDNMKAKIMSAPEWQEKPKATEPQPDPVIEDVDLDEPINLDDIPF